MPPSSSNNNAAIVNGKVNWRRVVAIASMVFALLLIIGSIYMHVRHKHHLGRLHHEPSKIAPSMGVAAATPLTQKPFTTTHGQHKEWQYAADYEDYEVEEEEQVAGSGMPTITVISSQALAAKESESLSSSSLSSSSSSSISASAETNESSKSNKANVREKFDERRVTEVCLQCICEAATSCEPVTCGPNVECGIYRISQLYWVDAGKPQLQGDASRNISDMGYSHCVNNVYCAGRTVEAYVRKYGRDCNHDGIIDCRDHVALHLLGPNGCLQSELLPLFEARMENCLANFE